MYPEAGQYINIHAHRGAAFPGEWVLRNQSVIEYPPVGDDPKEAWSVGLHPWDLGKTDVEQSLKKVRQAAGNRQVLAIGEAGLDTMIPVPLDVQTRVFSAQMEIAQKTGLPLIIHAVKSYQDLIALAKQKKPTVPMIIHGFRGGMQQAGDLMKFGYLLSFGEPLMRSDKLAGAFQAVPTGKFFLETDESDVPVEDLYEQAAKLRSVSTTELVTEMKQVFDHVFKSD